MIPCNSGAKRRDTEAAKRCCGSPRSNSFVAEAVNVTEQEGSTLAGKHNAARACTSASILGARNFGNPASRPRYTRLRRNQPQPRLYSDNSYLLLGSYCFPFISIYRYTFVNRVY